jgi:hypothetical protein
MRSENTVEADQWMTRWRHERRYTREEPTFLISESGKVAV